MADTQSYRPRKRGYESIKDMVWSLIPIVALVLVFVYFCGPRSDQATIVDPQSDISSAAREVGYQLVAPESLSDQWRVTSSVLLRDGNGAVTGLSIGYLTPEDEMARYVISSGSRDDVIGTALAKAEPVADPDGAEVTLADLSWTPVRTTAGRALVAEGDDFVVVAAGSSSYAELRELAGAALPVEG